MTSPRASNVENEPFWAADLRAHVVAAKRSRKTIAAAFAITMGALSLTMLTLFLPPRGTVQIAMIGTLDPRLSAKSPGASEVGVGLKKWLGTNAFVQLQKNGKAVLLSNGSTVRNGAWAWAQRRNEYSFSVTLDFGRVVLEEGDSKLTGRLDVLLGLAPRKHAIDYTALNWAVAKLELFAETTSGSAWELAVYQFLERSSTGSEK